MSIYKYFWMCKRKMLQSKLEISKETFGAKKEYCVCTAGYYGDKCQTKLEVPPLSEELLLFGNSDFLKSSKS